jgi:hypothetical protein
VPSTNAPPHSLLISPRPALGRSSGRGAPSCPWPCPCYLVRSIDSRCGDFGCCCCCAPVMSADGMVGSNRIESKRDLRLDFDRSIDLLELKCFHAKITINKIDCQSVAHAQTKSRLRTARRKMPSSNARARALISPEESTRRNGRWGRPGRTHYLKKCAAASVVGGGVARMRRSDRLVDGVDTNEQGRLRRASFGVCVCACACGLGQGLVVRGGGQAMAR